MSEPLLLRARPYWCKHMLFRVRSMYFPYWVHREYEIEIVGHGWTQAPRKNAVTEWALDWLSCDPENADKEWEVTVEWN